MELVFTFTLLFAVFFFLPNWSNRKTKFLSVLRHCDWFGMLLFLGCSVAILIVINVGGTVQPWNSPIVITCGIVGFLSLASLIIHQRYIAKNPAFPKAIFSKPVTNAAFVGSLVSGMLLSMIFYNLVLFWEGVRHLPTMKIGIMLLSVTLTYALSAAVVGITIKISGRIKWATMTGSVFAVTGLGLMWFMDQKTPVPPLIVISMLAAAGCGIFLPAMINTVLATTNKTWHSHAIAQRTLMYTAGQCMGVSIGLAIFTNTFAHQVTKLNKTNSPGGEVLVAVTPQSLMQVIKDLPPNSEVTPLIVYALRWVWGAACLMAILTSALACAFKCPALPKDKEHNGDPVTRDMELDEERRTDEVKKRLGVSLESIKILSLLRPSSQKPSGAVSSSLLVSPSPSSPKDGSDLGSAEARMAPIPPSSE